jgi:hypothetical protein
VDHAGELSAVEIYRAQAWVMKGTAMEPILKVRHLCAALQPLHTSRIPPVVVQARLSLTLYLYLSPPPPPPPPPPHPPPHSTYPPTPWHPQRSPSALKNWHGCSCYGSTPPPSHWPPHW